MHGGKAGNTLVKHSRWIQDRLEFGCETGPQIQLGKLEQCMSTLPQQNSLPHDKKRST